MKNIFLRNPSRVLMVVAVLLAGVMMTPFALATTPGANTDVPLSPATDITSFGDVINLIDLVFDILFWILIALASVFLIWAAFTYLTAGGDPEKVKQANHRIIYAVVAVVVAVLARAIPTVVCNFLADGCDTL